MSRKLAPLLLAGVTACGGGGPATAPIEAAASCAGPLAGEPVRSKPGARACTGPCLTAHTAACTEGEVWKVRFADHFQTLFGTLRVSTKGLTRVEQPDRNLYGVDGRLWLACIPRCGDVANVCFPSAVDLTLRTLKGVDDCTITTTPSEPWHGYASVTARFECNVGTFVVRAVPDLVGVRDAMRAGGLLAEDDPALELDALVVSMTHEGKTFEVIGEVAVEPCETLAVPEGHQVHATLADFDALSSHWEEIWTEVSSSSETSRDPSDIMRRVEAELCARYVEAVD
jgi:hypothetical protein